MGTFLKCARVEYGNEVNIVHKLDQSFVSHYIDDWLGCYNGWLIESTRACCLIVPQVTVEASYDETLSLSTYGKG